MDDTAGGELSLASGDASFRCYFRVRKDASSFIVMDAPPEKEDCRPFIRVAGFLESMGLNAPRVIEADLEQGFLLLTDLGQDQYLDALNGDDERVGSLYADAVNALLVMQRRGDAFQSSLPPYDEELLGFELSLFHDWLCGTHLGITFSDDEEASWQKCCDMLVANALAQPQVFVHRDYHSRNLMVTERDNPGILDFQDAVEGPLTYDLVSLLKDCYVRWPAARVRQWVTDFYAALPDRQREYVDFEQFTRFFELMGVQRHLKAAGIFARLNHRDGKTGYLADVPRTLSYIVELAPAYPELGFVCELILRKVLPALESDA